MSTDSQGSRSAATDLGVGRVHRVRVERSASVVQDDDDRLVLRTDVLVIGGGPAAMWSALAGRDAGARVLMVDKGYAGASGVAAPAGVGHWLVPPDPVLRDREISVRERQGGHLTDRRWTERVLDTAWDRLQQLQDWGYVGATRPGPLRSLLGQSPGYLRFLRGRVRRVGVTVLDHSPALELLTDGSGAVAGAAGLQRRTGRPWQVAAGAVVLATGGTTWQSHSLGGDVDTGDGHLMAVEVGARLSSMEMSSFYGMVPLGTSMDKNGFMVGASYWTEDGTPVDYENLHVSRIDLLGPSDRGQVYARLDHAPEDVWDDMRRAMPNFFFVFDRLGIDPFRERFPIDWVLEGTVRGTGGVQVRDFDAGSGVEGLHLAGDVAARDRIVGAATGAGGPNLAWAVASGTWAGAASAARAATVGTAPRYLHATGGRGIRGTRDGAFVDWAGVRREVQGHMHPIGRTAFRSDEGLRASLQVLDSMWEGIEGARTGSGRDAIKARETAAMLATARWADRAALARTESRGMHHRVDHPGTDPDQNHRLLTSGLDDVTTTVDPEAPVVGAERLVS